MEMCDFYVVCAHAPHAQSHESPVSWWGKLAKDISIHCHGNVSMLFCFDGNCQWYNTTSVNHGDVGCLTSSPPPRFTAMVKCLSASSIDMHSTMYDMYKDGQASDYATYVPTRGTNLVRIDYVGSRGKLKCVHGSIHINDDLSRNLLGKKDHRPLVASYVFQDCVGKSAHKRRLVMYDHKSFVDQDKGSSFCHQLANMDPIVLEVDTSSHCHLIETAVHDALVASFPIPKTSKRHDFLSDSTYDIIRQSHDAFKVFKKCERRIDKSYMYVIFGIWAGFTWRLRFSPVLGFNTAKSLRAWSCAKSNYCSLSKQVKGLVTMERLAQIDIAVCELEECFSRNDIVSMHKCVGSITKGTIHPSSSTSTRVVDKHGIISQTYAEERHAFKDHFCDLMQGDPMTFEQVVLDDRNDTRDRFGDFDFQDIWKSIPSPSDTLSMNLSAKVGKAPGENRIIGKVHRVFAKLITTLTYPLVLKTYARIQPPIQYKGGMIHEVYKMKGPMHLCSSFRDVLLANDSGKHICKRIRSKVMPWASRLVNSTQFGGGFNGGETSMAHLYARLCMQACRASDTSCGILFLDVVTAFATMLRRSIFSIDDGDESWLKSLSNAGFSASDVKAIYDTVAELSKWCIDADGNVISDSVNYDNLSLKVAQHWFTHTWMSTEGIAGVFVTNVGCMAGTPFADLAFTVAISRILYVFRRSLHSDDLESHVIINGNDHKMSDVSFVDDTACPVCAPACSLASKVAAIARVALNTFKCFGLDLNFRSGKSECVLSFHGKGKQLAKRSLAACGNVTHFVNPNGIEIALHCVSVYKHVGTRIPFDIFMGEEVSARCGMIRQTLGRLKSNIFLNNAIEIRKRLIIFQIYVLTRGMFQACTWSELKGNIYVKFHKCIMDCYRHITGHYYLNPDGKEMMTDDLIIEQYALMSPHTLLRVSRLSLFARLVAKAPSSFKSLMIDCASIESSWSSDVMSDLHWFTVSGAFSECCDHSFGEWIESVKATPKFFKREVNKFARSGFANVLITDPKTQAIPSNPLIFECNLCTSNFDTLQKYNLHLFKKHGIRNPIRLYINNHTHCSVCLKLFWTRARLLNHLKFRSKVCKFNLYMRGTIVDEETALAQDGESAAHNSSLYSRGRRNHFASDPVLQLHGPVRPIILQNGCDNASHHRLGFGHNYHS